MSVLDELAAAIEADPDNLATYAVYGDVLAEAGDPRGELMATQLAAESGDAEMKRAALRVFAKHRDVFLGELGSMIAADAFTWRAGFIQRAVLSHDRLLVEGGARVAATVAEVVATLLAHPSARFLTDLVIRASDRDVWGRTTGSQRETVDRIAAARPRVLRRLQLGDAQYGYAHVGRLDHLWPAVPQLRELVIEGEASLGALVLPELRAVALRPMPLRRRGAKELLEADWPKLRSLRITFQDQLDHVAREVVQLVGRDHPCLAELALVGFRGAEAVIEALVASPLLRRLEALDLSHGHVSDRALRPIFANAARFAHLDVLDLASTQVTPSTLARLQRVVPGARGA